MKRRYRPVVAVLLALLLVLVQQGAQLHALGHVGDRLQSQHDTALQLPVGDAACAMCALFAGGSDATTTTAAAPPTPTIEYFPPSRAIALATAGSPSPYQSRAPPSTL